MKDLTREILREARGHGACDGETDIVSPCNSHPCDLDCLWSDWSEEAACTKSCGGGTKMMTRSVMRNSSGNGLPCTGETIRLDDCNDFICPDILAALIVLCLVLAITIIYLGILCYSVDFYRKIIDNERIPKVSFSMPNIVKITK